MAIKDMHLVQDVKIKDNFRIPMHYLRLGEDGATEEKWRDTAVFYRFERCYMVSPMDGAHAPSRTHTYIHTFMRVLVVNECLLTLSPGLK